MTGRSPATETERTTYRMPANPNAVRFVQALETYRSPEQRGKYRRYFKLDEGQYGEGDVFIGVRMGQVFALAKEFIDMPPEDIEKLLESPIHEVRAGATASWTSRAAARKLPKAVGRRFRPLPAARGPGSTTGTLSTLPLLTWSDATCPTNRAMSCTSWRAPKACGSAGPPSSPPPTSSGRTTWPTLEIAEVLLGDDQDLIHKAAGGWVREAGKKDRPRLLGFLDKHATAMHAQCDYAIEHLDKEQRTHYLEIKGENR